MRTKFSTDILTDPIAAGLMTVEEQTVTRWMLSHPSHRILPPSRPLDPVLDRNDRRWIGVARNVFTRGPRSGRGVTKGTTKAGLPWRVLVVHHPRVSKALVEFDQAPGRSPFWRMVDVVATVGPDVQANAEEPTYYRVTIDGIRVSVSNVGLGLVGDDQPSVDVPDEIFQEIVPHVATTFVEKVGRFASLQGFEHTFSEADMAMRNWLVCARQAAEQKRVLEDAALWFTEILHRLPDKIRDRIDTWDLTTIASGCDYMVSGSLGTVRLFPASDASGVSVKPTTCASRHRRIGDVVVKADGPHVMRDGSVRGLDFVDCTREAGEDALRQTVLRALEDRPWIFDRETLGVAARRLLEARREDRIRIREMEFQRDRFVEVYERLAQVHEVYMRHWQDLRPEDTGFPGRGYLPVPKGLDETASNRRSDADLLW